MHADEPHHRHGVFERLASWCVRNRVVVLILAMLLLLGGAYVAPFRGVSVFGERDPISVDALPDITDNQQIVFTSWPGRSPTDISDQVAYPLSAALLGTPGVRSIRSSSMFGFAIVHVIFEDEIDFYWARSRVSEKLASLPPGSLPEGVVPRLGPEASGLGQIYWYTLEVRDENGRPVGGVFSLDELRSIQDWNVRYVLQGVPGVAEVASIGGHVREYQVEVDRDAMRVHGVTLQDVVASVRAANRDVGARTMEINGVEYLIRGLGRVKDIEDIESAIIGAHEGHTPIRVRDVASVQLGPALRRGALDDSGVEAVGGVVTARYGANPMEVSEQVRARIATLGAGLPSRTLDDGRIATVHVVPFYDRATLIDATLHTLSEALHHELLITVLVVLLLLMNLESAALVSAVLPLSIAGTLLTMRAAGVGANVMALAGIAIAIGTMVDVAIVFVENIRTHLRSDGDSDGRRQIARAVGEVAPAVMTALATTVLSFLPIFGLTGQEGKMFAPLAVTKTLALVAAGVVSLLVLPAFAAMFLTRDSADAGGHAGTQRPRFMRLAFEGLLMTVAVAWWASGGGALAVAWMSVAVFHALSRMLPATKEASRTFGPWRVALSREGVLRTLANAIAGVTVVWMLATAWAPLGMGATTLEHAMFLAVVLGLVIGGFAAFRAGYAGLLYWSMRRRVVFVGLNLLVVGVGAVAWLGLPTLTARLPTTVTETRLIQDLERHFPGLQEDFIPPFDEGVFLYMPSTTANASMGQALQYLQRTDAAITALPEVRRAVGKLGRAETPLDPAPISMLETIIELEPEYRLNARGEVGRFAYDASAGAYSRDEDGALVPDPDGRPYRNWRPEIQSSDDIWRQIAEVSRMPGLSGVSKLQPIETRTLMLQTGMRASVGIKVFGPTLEAIEAFSTALEPWVRGASYIAPETVFVERVVGKPYLELEIDREAIGRHGLSVGAVQDTIEAAIGGRAPTSTIEGRERYGVRVRYPRETRDTVDAIGSILVAGHRGEQVPLRQLVDIRYARGPQMIRAEDTYLVGFITFEPAAGVTSVEAARALEKDLRDAISRGALEVPTGARYAFSGTYEGQVRSQAKLRVLVPIALATIFMLLYLQFRRVRTTLIVFFGVVLAAAGGMLSLWFWGHPTLPEALLPSRVLALFPVQEIPLTVTVWVGFLVLFGVATDNGVILATYLDQHFATNVARDDADIFEGLRAAATRRLRPCLMTTATTLLALLPILTSAGRGADLMIPMALPLFGGVIMSLLTLLTVPVLYGTFVVRPSRTNENAPSRDEASTSS